MYVVYFIIDMYPIFFSFFFRLWFFLPFGSYRNPNFVFVQAVSPILLCSYINLISNEKFYLGDIIFQNFLRN